MRDEERLYCNARKGFDRQKYVADFDKFMDEQFAQTMGNLISPRAFLRDSTMN